MKQKPLIHFITNYVSMNDVANACIAVGGRPIMAEAIEEVEDIIEKANGVVLNMGTLNQQRLKVIEEAAIIANRLNKPVLLDPVGCGASTYRLNNALNIIEKGHISILKCNAKEAKALLYKKIDHEAVGVDGVLDHNIDHMQQGQALYDEFSQGRSDFVVVITGEKDIIVSKNQVQLVTGGSLLQQQITGTGCMLNAIIMTCVTENHEDLFANVIKAITIMNQSSERAANRLKNKRYSATYRSFLVDELSNSKKIVYLVTDEKLDYEKELIPKTKIALEHGVKMLQYRAKERPKEIKIREAMGLKKLAKAYGATFIINDDVLLAREIMADGVHIGANDMSVEEARSILGRDAIIGVTAKTLEQAVEAEANGADYLGVGAIFPSPTKNDAIRISKDTLVKIKRAVHIPIYGIGGITSENLTLDIAKVIDGVAVVSCVYNSSLVGSKDTVELVINKLYEKLES